jgi:transposase
MAFCESCFEKQRQIDALTEEIRTLKDRLRYLKRKAQQGFFGSSTPSSQVPVKANTPQQRQAKRGGAQPGHAGHGRSSFDAAAADQVIPVESIGDRCPWCGGPLQNKGVKPHSVLERDPPKTQRRLYLEPHQYCRRCRRTVRSHAPGVLPKSLYGNHLMAQAATMHYLDGLPMGRICQQLDIGLGSLIEIFHRLAKVLDPIHHKVMKHFRQSPVKHADETSWRNDGQSGYVWLFASPKISLFLFAQSRSATVVRKVLGTEPLPGTLVVDRYKAYDKAPCALQYCYAHLLRMVQDLQKEFPIEEEIHAFVSTLAPLLAEAMHLHPLTLPDRQYDKQANKIKSQILKVVHSPAQHLAIRRIQEIFHENAHRLYRWVEDRRVPADNNLAERDLRPTVIARKISFGSQSDAGAHTRSVLMTVLYTLRKQLLDPGSALKSALDHLAQDPTRDPFELLFPNGLIDTS